MIYFISILLILTGIQDSSSDPIRKYKDALLTDNRDKYHLSFLLTTPVDLQNPVYQSLKFQQDHYIDGKNYFGKINQMHPSRNRIDRLLTIGPELIQKIDDAPYIKIHTKYRPEQFALNHKISIKKFCRIPSPLIMTYSLDEKEMVQILDKLKLESDDGTTVTYSGIIRPNVTMQLGLNKKHPTYPTFVTITEKGEGGSRYEMVNTFNNGSGMPSKCEYKAYDGKQIRTHQVIDAIKLEVIPQDFRFSHDLLEMQVNETGLRDDQQTVYWDGTRFSDLPTAGTPEKRLQISYFYLVNGIILILTGATLTWFYITKWRSKNAESADAVHASPG